MSLESIVIISAIIQIVVLICFFSLCSTVNSIKSRIGGTETTRMDKFNIYIMMGQIDKAKDILSQMIISESEWEHVFNHKYPALMDKSRKSLQTKYEELLNLVDLKLDFEQLDKINQ